jgi:tetratricopeptide (TPR) repeat protein
LGTHADILTLLAAWGQALGDDSVEKLVGLEARQKAVRRVIGQQRFLLILDDVWQAEDVLAMQCGGANCRMLVTTRDTAVAQTVATAARIQPIEPLTKADALTLLQTMAPKAWATNTTAITQLAESVGGLPLALALLGGYLAIPEWGDLTGLNQPAKGLADIKQRLALAQRQLKGKQQVTVTKLVALSLASLPPTAIAAWIALGAFASKPASFIQPAAVAVARTDGRTLELLLACHLLERTKDGLTLPRILADVARTMLVPWSKISPLPPPAPKQPNRSWRITRPTIRLVEGAAIEPLTQQTAVERHRTYYIKLITGGDWRWIDGAYKQIQWAWLQLPNEEVASWVRYIRGYQLKQRSEHEFLVWAKRGLLAARAVKNRKDESIMLNYIGEICHNWRRFSEAMRFYDQALSIKQELNDKIGEHDVRYNIAQVFKEQGLLTEAVAEMTQVMALTNRFYKESDIDELRHMERMLKKSSWAKLGP